MLSQYMTAALDRTQYDLIDDEEPYYGGIPEIQGVWATGKTLEQCRRNLAAALEDWLFLSIAMGLPIPVIGGIELKPPAMIAS